MPLLRICLSRPLDLVAILKKPAAFNLPPEILSCIERAGSGTSAFQQMSRALYCLRHRNPPKVFPVTVVKRS
jgi:hypothetical protein